MHIRILKIVIIFAILIACAKKRPASSPDVFFIPAPPISAQQIADQALVECADQDQCPPEIGMLVNIQAPNEGPSGVALCTAFAISQSEIMTNSHCLSPHLRKPTKTNANELRVFFPANKEYDSSYLEISRIVFASSIGNSVRTRDFAILETAKPLPRPFLNFNRGGVLNLESLQIAKIDPTSTIAAKGRLVQTNCKNIQRSLLLPAAFGPLSPLIGLSDCNIIGGNSGSPLFDTNRQVKAIIQARLQMAEEKRKSILASTGVEKIPSFAVATNMACVSSAGEPLPIECLMQPDRWEQERPAIGEQLLPDSEFKQFQNDWWNKAIDWNRSPPKWELRRIRSGKTSAYALLPTCRFQPDIRIQTKVFWLDLAFNQYLQAQGQSREDHAEINYFSENEFSLNLNGEQIFSDQLTPCTDSN